MPIRCPKCGAKHDVVELEEAASLKCRCGFKLDLSLIQTADDFLRYCEGKEELERAKEIQSDAQIICQMILNEECPEIDIEIARPLLTILCKSRRPVVDHAILVVVLAGCDAIKISAAVGDIGVQIHVERQS